MKIGYFIIFQTEPRVHIVEVYDKLDSEKGVQEGPLLTESLGVAAIPCHYYKVKSREEFFEALRNIELLNGAAEKVVEILHITGHGNHNAIGNVDDWSVDWNECRDHLIRLNRAVHGLLILCVSSCFGTAAIKLVKSNDELPFFALVGNYEAPTAQECAIAFVSFYHLLSVKGFAPDEAVRGMNAAAGVTGFQFLPAAQQQQIWHIHLENENMLDGALRRGDVSGSA